MGNIPLGKSVKSPLSIIKNIINVADTDKGKTFKNKEVNGKIDKDFNQGHLGDCALLSTLYGFSRTKEGAQAIEDALVELTDDAGDVTGYQVTFDKGDDDKNNDEIYTITKQELEAAKNGTNGRQYSKGDDDVTLLELALEKSFNQSQDPVLRNLVDNYTSVNNVIIGKSSDGSPVTGVDVKGSDGNNVQLIAPHAYAVKSISNGVVSLMDPNDSSKVIQVKQESLLGLEKFHAYSLPVE